MPSPGQEGARQCAASRQTGRLKLALSPPGAGGFWGAGYHHTRRLSSLERFRASEPWTGHWAAEPRSWDDLPEERFLSAETHACIKTAIAALAPAQRDVITLRDVKGWTAEEVCGVLGLSAANQRVLLHRARSKVRGALEQYFDQVAGGPS
jgi:RNA polymerase sigma-70 factor (ECF subfamily)